MVVDRPYFTKVAGEVDIFMDEPIVAVDLSFEPSGFANGIDGASEDMVAGKKASLPIIARLGDVFEEEIIQFFVAVENEVSPNSDSRRMVVEKF